MEAFQAEDKRLRALYFSDRMQRIAILPGYSAHFRMHAAIALDLVPAKKSSGMTAALKNGLPCRCSSSAAHFIKHRPALWHG